MSITLSIRIKESDLAMIYQTLIKSNYLPKSKSDAIKRAAKMYVDSSPFRSLPISEQSLLWASDKSYGKPLLPQIERSPLAAFFSEADLPYAERIFLALQTGAISIEENLASDNPQIVLITQILLKNKLI